MTVKILSFVNHIPPADGIETSIEQAFAWGVDVVVAQGTGSDWGPYFLGSGFSPAANVAENVRPYVRAAVRHGVPFIFSFGTAGGDIHLDRVLGKFNEVCAEEGWQIRVGVIHSELDKQYLLQRIADGSSMVPVTAGAPLVPELTAREVRDAERIVALIGPEPVMTALSEGVEGVITGRALDIGLYMAFPMLEGLPIATAAFAGKLLECGGLALSPGDSAQCIWAELDDDGLEVRSPNPALKATVQGMVSHTFYERSHPTREENPGGTLDLGSATYTPTELGVRCAGARWIPAPYTVLLEGAHRTGFRAISMFGVREPALLAQIREWTGSAERTTRESPRFAAHFESGRARMTTRVFGLDGVLGPLEPNHTVTGHEASVILDVVAETRELAEEIAYFGFIRLYIGPYPERKTTAGNAAAPFMPVVIPVSEVYEFSIYHLLELEDPGAPFPVVVESFPRAVAEVSA
jgi:hypothetical protein